MWKVLKTNARMELLTSMNKNFISSLNFFNSQIILKKFINEQIITIPF